MSSVWDLLRALSHLVLHVFNHHPFLTIFGLLTIEEAGIPIPVPGDMLLMLAGSQQHRPVWFSLVVIAIASAAVMCGSSVLYAVMRRGGRPLLLKYGALFHLHPERVTRMEGWFRRRGRWALILGRLIPGLRIPTTIMAGIAGITYREYVVYAGIAAVLWSSIYVVLGAGLLRIWPLIVALIAEALDDVPRAVLLVIGIGGGVMALLGVIGGIMQMLRRRWASGRQTGTQTHVQPRDVHSG